jgi:hypothetical protein
LTDQKVARILRMTAMPFRLLRYWGGAPAKVAKATPSERANDPVRLYLCEISSVDLLSREGEVAIAKRIEAAAGR